MSISRADYMAFLIEKAGWRVCWGWNCVAVEGTQQEIVDLASRLTELGMQIKNEGMRNAMLDVIKNDTRTEQAGQTARMYWPSLLMMSMSFVRPGEALR